MRMRVQLEIELEVDKSILEDNNELMTDEEIATCLGIDVPAGSFLSCVDEAVEVLGIEVLNHHRVPSRKG